MITKQLIFLALVFIPLLAGIAYVTWEMLLGIKEAIIVIRLLKGECNETAAEVIKVKKYLTSGRLIVWRYYCVKYKFDNYFGSSFVSRYLTDELHGQKYTIGEKIPILYLKNNPSVNAAAEIVSYDTLVKRATFPLIVLLFIVFGIVRAKSHIS